MFRKLDLLLSSGEGRATPTLLGALEGANLKHRTDLSKFKGDYFGLRHDKEVRLLSGCLKTFCIWYLYCWGS
jgi:hypothetical protein